MPVLAAAARIVLIGVFTVAAIAKVRDGAAFRRTLTDFGVPARLVPLTGALLPWIELAAAALLLWDPAATSGAALALSLLLIFSALIALNLARGRAPDCRCFGSFSAGRVGARTLFRNAALAAAAALVLAAGSDAGWREAGSAGVGLTSASLAGGLTTTLLLGLFGVQTGLFVVLLLQHGRVLLRLEALEGQITTAAEGGRVGLGLPIGARAPDFDASDATGRSVTLATLRAGGTPIVLVFADRGCSHCDELGPSIASWQLQLRGTVRVIVLARGTAETARVWIEQRGVSDVFLHPDLTVPDAYNVRGVPAAVLIGADGRVASATSFGADAVARMVDQIASADRAGILGAPRAPAAGLTAAHAG